jgi:hypothetical protein
LAKRLVERSEIVRRTDFQQRNFDRLGSERTQPVTELARLMSGAGHKDPPSGQRLRIHRASP